jgi:hypothetical protein
LRFVFEIESTELADWLDIGSEEKEKPRKIPRM